MLDETVVLDGTGRALITDLETGRVMTCSVPTAKENVRLGQGRFVHGAVEVAEPAPPAPVVDDPVIELTRDDVMPLPAPAVDSGVEAVADPAIQAQAQADLQAREHAESAPDRNADITAALGLLNEFDYVGNGERKGKPKCSAIENIVGYPVFVKEVDAAWDARGV